MSLTPQIGPPPLPVETAAPAVPPPLPSALPPPPPTLPPGVEVYRMDNRAMTYGEWWRTIRSWQVIFGWGAKLLRLDTFSKGRVLRIADMRALEADEASVPVLVREQLAAQVAELQAAGFVGVRYIHVFEPIGQMESTGAELYLPGSGIIARVLCAIARAVPSVKPTLSTVLISVTPEGELFGTCDQPMIFQPPQGHHGSYPVGAKPAQLLSEHRRLLERHSASLLRLTNSADDAWDLANFHEASSFAAGIAAGRYVPLTPGEVQTDEVRVRETPADPKDARVVEAVREMETLRTKAGSKWTMLLILGLTLAVSLGAGVHAWSWRGGLIIIGVLLFHEYGHYLAMRLFGYRDLKMFFVPLLGAAVTGRHYNMPGWKKALVSLAGPLPGIALSLPVAVLAAWKQNADLAHVALMLATLNLFNLIPILPLDGGSFWNSVLFCRHRWADVAFRAFAGFALIGVSLAGESKFWLYLGLVMLFALPNTLMLGRVVKRVRARGVENAAADDDTVPPVTARAIIEEVDADTKGKLPPKMLASNGLQVFEQINSRPPNWLEGFGLAALYFISIIAGVIGLVIVVVGMEGNEKFGRQLAESAGKSAPEAEVAVPPKPTLKATLPLAAGDHEIAAAKEEDETPSARQVVAQFADVASAKAAFAQVRGALEPREELTRLGETVLLYSPSRRSTHPAELAAQFQKLGAKSVIGASPEPTWIGFDLSARLPEGEAGAKLSMELGAWFDLETAQRPPVPWKFSAERRAKLVPAWLACQRASNTRYEAFNDPEVQNFRSSAKSDGWLAIFKGKPSSQLQEQMKVMKAVRHRRIQALIDQRDPTLDAAVLAHYLQEPDIVSALTESRLPARTEWNRELARLIGVPSPETAAEDEHTFFGNVHREAGRIEFRNLSIVRATRELPALLDYLAAQGCTDLHYGLNTSEDMD